MSEHDDGERLEPVYEIIGSRIESRRLAFGMTQQQLGDLLNPSRVRGYINNIEKGHQRVPIHVLVQIAEALGVSLTALMPKAPKPLA